MDSGKSAEGSWASGSACVCDTSSSSPKRGVSIGICRGSNVLSRTSTVRTAVCLHKRKGYLLYHNSLDMTTQRELLAHEK